MQVSIEEQLELFPPAVQCSYRHCNEPTHHPFWVVKHVGRSSIQLPFCNEQHANAEYLERLREEGL